MKNGENSLHNFVRRPEVFEDLNGGNELKGIAEPLKPFSTRENLIGIKRLVGERFVSPSFVPLLVQESNEFSNTTSKIQGRYPLSNFNAGKEI
jgi:hypothetical protein